MSVIDKLKQRAKFNKTYLETMKSFPVKDDSFAHGYIYALGHELSFIEEIIEEMEKENERD